MRGVLIAGVVAVLGVAVFLGVRLKRAPGASAPVRTADALGVGVPHHALGTPATKAPEAEPVPAVPMPLAVPVTTFGQTGPVRLEDVPAGRFRDELARLPPGPRQAALTELSRRRVPFNDIGSLSVDSRGALFYECTRPEPAAGPEFAASDSMLLQEASTPIASPPVRHSRPGATKVIYLDFNGHTITGTAWNEAKGLPGDVGYRPAVASYLALPFDNDGSPTTFSDGEQQFIIRIWKRVSEDFAGFDVDVTTEEPAVFTPTTARALITNSTDANGVSMPSPNAGGVAYLGRFGASDYVSTYSPAIVYYNNLLSMSAYVGEAVSHEVGHNLGLGHDGTLTSEYYEGHRYAATSWAPIMGSAYYANVSQWSKGEYYNANNPQDDLAIIAGYIGYAADDHGDGPDTATALAVSGNLLSGLGIVGSPGDVDWFTFSADNQALHFQVDGFRSDESTVGGNLDVRLELYSAAGTLVAEETAASAYTMGSALDAGLPAGTYFLKVTGTGTGQPLISTPSGYTNYGSLGQFTISGVLSDPVVPAISSFPINASAQEGQTVYYSVNASGGNPVPQFQWQYLPAGGSIWADLTENATYVATASNRLQIVGVTTAMNGDQFRCRVFNIAGAVVSQAAVLNVSPAVAPQIYNMPVYRPVDYSGSFSLSPSISGTSPITYAWYKDGVVIPGATYSSYTKGDVTADDAGSYTLTATNAGGSATSSGTTVVVNPPVAPAIYNLPQAVVRNTGDHLGLYPNITGTNPISYQWAKDGVSIAGATSLSYSHSSLTAADAGSYTLTATNAWGSSTSPAVAVTVNAPVAPAIFGLPASTSASYGGNFALSPTITGTAPITYQWTKDGVPISGATSSYYSKSGLVPADGGTFMLTATNAQGSVTSTGCTLTVAGPVAPYFSGVTSNLTLDYGGNLNLFVSVYGTNPMTMQWKKDGVAIAGATSSYFLKGGATTADSGTYTLTATNVAGTTVTTDIVVTVRAATAPVVYGLPSTVAVAYGQTLSLSPIVLGTAPLTYQWKKDGIALAGKTSNYLSKSGITAADAGSYTLTVSNFLGTVTSSPVAVLVDAATAPSIYGLPPAVTVAYGESLSLSPSVVGTSPIACQWKRDDVILTGMTSSNFYKSALTASDAGNYTLVAANAWGTTTSSAVAVTVSPAVAPTISGLPSTLTVAYGTNFTLSPVVSGTRPITYEWKKDGMSVPGATSSYFSKGAATFADSGSYTVTVTNLVGSTTSGTVAVTVNPAVPPVLLNSLGGPYVMNHGDTLSLSISVSGTNPITLQWKKDGVVIPGTSSNYFSKSYVTAADSGSYTVTATNSVGSTTSSAASVTVNPPLPPSIHGLPAAVAVDTGGSLYLSPTVSGTSPITYRWQRDGVDLPGQTSSYLSRQGVTVDDAGAYTLIASNAWGTTTSSTVTVVVNPAVAPGIYNLPPVVNIDYGTSLQLNATVFGTTPIIYQWRRDGVIIPNATSSNLYINYTTTAEAGQYTLTATNAVGSVTSDPITVNVRNAIPPVITDSPVPVTATFGLNARFMVQATGTSPLNYQWYHDGQPVTGATLTSLVVTAVKASDLGQYHVVVTNPGGSLSSTPVALEQDSNLAVIGIDARGNCSFRIRSDHTLWAAGRNYSGQLGDGTTVDRLNARQVATGVAAVAAGYAHTLVLKEDGTLWAMGANSYGEFGNGSTTGSTLPIQVASGVTGMAASYSTTYFIRNDATLWAVGNNTDAQLGDGAFTGRTIPVQIATGVSRVAAGSGHALFLKTDGTLWGMGRNYSGQLGDGTSNNRATPVQVDAGVTAIAAGGNFSAFIKTDGSLWTTGENYSGQLGDGTTSARVTPVQVATDAIAVAAGDSHVIFITSDHKLWGMGSNYIGQLGDSTSNNRSTPVEIASGVDRAAAGGNCSLYVDTNGALWGMGENNYGQLGDGLVANTNLLPVQLTRRSSIAPVITAQPIGQRQPVGASVTFTVGATGTEPLGYQWRRGGVNLPGATSPTYNAGSATLAMAGTYDVVVTNPLGTVTSDPVVLAVDKLPQTINFDPIANRPFTAAAIPLSVSSSSGLPVTVSVLSGLAYMNGGNLYLGGTGVIVLRASQAGDEIYAAAPEVDRSFTVTGNYASWLAGIFSSLELADSAVSGPNAVYSQDGLSNLVKYALGLEPKQNVTTGLPVVGILGSDWTYTYTRPDSITDVSYEVEVSTNLVDWNSAGVTHEWVSNSNGIDTWRGRIALSHGAKVFFRLKITRP